MAKVRPFYLEPLKQLSNRLDRLVEGRLWLKVLIGLGLGILLGLLLGPELNLIPKPAVIVITSWLALPGQLFLALIQMIVVPLVIASIVRGLAANRNPKALKQIGLIAIGFILITTIIGTVTGIGLGQWIEPGHHINSESLETIELATATDGTPSQNSFPSAADMPDKVVSLFPKNPMASMVSGEMLQVVLFAAILGFALISIAPKQAQPLFDLLGALQEVSMRVVSWAMSLAPLAVFGLITKLVSNLGLEVLTGMLLYVVTVIAGLLVLALFYLGLIKLLGRYSIKTFVTEMRELLLLAFSTSSSAAVMPLSLQVTENTFGVRPGIARFLIPLGATINMTGTALYQGVATVFLAQAFSVDLTLTNYVFVVTMAIAASIGSPATPGAGIVILSMVLEGVGIPAAGVALLLGVDRILDMCRTTINVLGDVVMCCITDKLLPADADIETENA
ncbi:dicarboxylate/amino acid:cation symporter [Aestuariicella sp. G3-2]|uniref:dicarboxylate/amino acid:cation symporter n=1 Tax=Pseudomaricurvus albidus TaxID=2842452 RepID=UPI001C0D2BF9|nr:dicarboxylate/amino acid:cation symporter [Aestuariicella albida]MBU3068673.1 dicarboxylate/amino acid:cation symporter [Aestuariicella albida]